MGVGTTFEIIRRAADGDADLAALWAMDQRARRAVVTRVLDAALADTERRPGLSRDEAIDLFWLLYGPEIVHLLTVTCGWSAERFEAWLPETFCEQLLAPPASMAWLSCRFPRRDSRCTTQPPELTSMGAVSL